MSFVGDLEHLPIVDVIQLLHATRKSGTLCMKSLKGRASLFSVTAALSVQITRTTAFALDRYLSR